MAIVCFLQKPVKGRSFQERSQCLAVIAVEWTALMSSFDSNSSEMLFGRFVVVPLKQLFNGSLKLRVSIFAISSVAFNIFLPLKIANQHYFSALNINFD